MGYNVCIFQIICHQSIIACILFIIVYIEMRKMAERTDDEFVGYYTSILVVITLHCCKNMMEEGDKHEQVSTVISSNSGLTFRGNKLIAEMGSNTSVPHRKKGYNYFLRVQ